jgi:hypothetical protein
MNLPGFTAESSAYRTHNHYRSTAGGSFLGDEGAGVIPQGCGWLEGILCGALIATGTVVCTASCLASVEAGGFPCWACWSAFLVGSAAACWDCIPAWMQSIINEFESGGGDGGSGGGGGGNPPPAPCCPINTTCRCGGRCVPGKGCVGGKCLRSTEVCQ